MDSPPENLDLGASGTRLRLAKINNTRKRRLVTVPESDDSEELPSQETTLDADEIERLHKDYEDDVIRQFEEDSSLEEISSDDLDSDDLDGVVANSENMESDEPSIDLTSNCRHEHSRPRAGSKRRRGTVSAPPNPYTLRDVYPVRLRSEIPQLMANSEEEEDEYAENGVDADVDMDGPNGIGGEKEQ